MLLHRQMAAFFASWVDRCPHLSLDGAMSRIPPMVSIRALREAHGLDLQQMAVLITEQGVEVHPDSLSNIERGNKAASRRLIGAWARALNLRQFDIKQHDDLVTQVDATRGEESAA